MRRETLTKKAAEDKRRRKKEKAEKADMDRLAVLMNGVNVCLPSTYANGIYGNAYS